MQFNLVGSPIPVVHEENVPTLNSFLWNDIAQVPLHCSTA